MGKKNMMNKGPSGARVEVISGRSVVLYAVSTSNVLAVSPNSVFARAAAIADVFQFYRFTKLKCTIIPRDVEVIMGYAPGAAFDTPPTTGPGIIELPIAVWHGAAKFDDTKMLVPRKELVPDAQIPWFKTIPGTPATQFEIQGNLYFSIGAGATGGTIVMDYTIEFQSWNLAAQSPLLKVPKAIKSASDGQCKENSDVLVVGGVTYKKSTA